MNKGQRLIKYAHHESSPKVMLKGPDRPLVAGYSTDHKSPHFIQGMGFWTNLIPKVYLKSFPREIILVLSFIGSSYLSYAY